MSTTNPFLYLDHNTLATSKTAVAKSKRLETDRLAQLLDERHGLPLQTPLEPTEHEQASHQIQGNQKNPTETNEP